MEPRAEKALAPCSLCAGGLPAALSEATITAKGDHRMQATASPAESGAKDRARGRFAFFSWFFALLGVGAVMLSLLLGGVVAWSSPVGLILLGLSLLGIISLCAALASLFRARRGREDEGAARAATGGFGK